LKVGSSARACKPASQGPATVWCNLTFGPAWRMTGASDFLSPFDSFHQLQIS
jgi:hypothetical protein